MIINNAGIFAFKHVTEYTSDEVEKLFRINVMSHFWIIKEFLPKMIQTGHGHIVAIASAVCFLTPGMTSCYSASKYAVHGFMESLRDEIYRYDNGPKLKLTTVYPFIMRTNMSQNFKVQFRLVSPDD